jgi:hypothetical protein
MNRSVAHRKDIASPREPFGRRRHRACRENAEREQATASDQDARATHDAG